MKILFMLSLLAAFNMSYGQQKITFEYDLAGNQIKRTLCLTGCAAKQSGEGKEIAAISDDDLQKFSEADVISYYPNPVKEELYLKWDVLDGNNVLSIMVYGINGQVLASYTQRNELNTQNIAFQQYPEGVYIVALNYKNGDQKTIKIIKQ